MTLPNSVTPSMDEKTAQIDAICRQARILPVVTIDSEAQILPMVGSPGTELEFAL